MNKLDKFLDETPPTDQPTRYGNKAFRTWYSIVEKVPLLCIPPISQESPNLMKDLVQGTQERFELASYLVSSIGNNTRIDYGSGHEASFVQWMYCLKVLGLVDPNDYFALVAKLFFRYFLSHHLIC